MKEYEVKVVRPTVHGVLGRLTPGQKVRVSETEAVKYGELLKLSKKEQEVYDGAKAEAAANATDTVVPEKTEEKPKEKKKG